jgi:hypothetical protein
VGLHGIDALNLLGHAEEVGVAQHGELRLAGGSGGRAQQGHVGGRYRVEQLREQRRLLSVERLAERFDLREEEQPLVIVHVSRQALGVVVDHPIQPGQGTLYVQHLVHLLLVFRHDDACSGGFQDMLQLVLDRVLVDPDGEGAQSLRRQLGDDPLRSIVPDDGYGVRALHAQPRQAQGEAPHPRQVVGPADFLPDSELLLTQGDRLGRRPGTVPKKIGQRCGRPVPEERGRAVHAGFSLSAPDVSAPCSSPR